MTLPADRSAQLRDRFEAPILVADIVGEILSDSMTVDDPDSRREVNVDIPSSPESVPLQLLLEATPSNPMKSRSVTDIAQLIQLINREISPIKVQVFSNGVAGNVSLMSPSRELDKDSLLGAVQTAARYARLLPEWRNLVGPDMEWSPELWIISPVHLAAHVPLWGTDSQEPSGEWEKRLSEAVSVKLGFGL